MRVAHCSCYSGCFLSIERLYPPTAGCLREAASAVELGEPAVATAASKTDQSKVGKTTSADQQASPTNQGEFGETSSTSQHGTRTDQGDLGRTPPPPPPQRKPVQPRTNASIPAVEQEREAKFKAAEAKAKREGVGSLTRENIDGLTPEQLKEIRGY